MSFLTKLQTFLKKCEEHPILLQYPALKFFRDFVVAAGELSDGDRDGNLEEGETVETDVALQEWFESFSKSLIMHSGKIIQVPKFLPNGDESRYLTNFVEKKLLGSGGAGFVYECESVFTKQRYAIKMMEIQADQDFNKMLREVEIISSLTHPNIVRYYEAWIESQMDESKYNLSDEEGAWVVSDEEETTDEIRSGCDDVIPPCLYLLMEYCSSSLKAMLEDEMLGNAPEKRSLSTEKRLKLAKEIIGAVTCIHEHGIIHGDLAPANVFLTKDGQAKVGDFGQSRKAESNGRFQISNNDGMKLYKAPEMGEGHDVDNKVDIYSLGVTFGELLKPFSTHSERSEVLETMKKENEIPDEWRCSIYGPTLQKMTSHDPKVRPSAADLLEKFEEYFPMLRVQ